MKPRKKSKLLLTTGVAIAGIAVSMLGSTLVVKRAAQGRIYTSVKTIPHRPVAVVLGCSKTATLFFRNRITAAAELYDAGKVDYLIVSGDNHRANYDEPTDMKNSLIALGVPAERIYCDYAGFRTLDSIVRAREIFAQTAITVVSQQFHNERALFLAKAHDLDALAYNAADVDQYAGFSTNGRELLARVKAVLDVYLLRTEPKFYGPPVVID